MEREGDRDGKCRIDEGARGLVLMVGLVRVAGKPSSLEKVYIISLMI